METIVDNTTGMIEAAEAKLTTGLLCPSCERPMAFTEVTHSYRCHACNPIPENVPECATQKCKLPLTRLGEPWNCWICLKCNKHPEEVNKMRKEEDQRKRKYLDKKLTTEDVSEMIKKEMAGVKDMIREALVGQRPDYPPTQAEIKTMTATETINAKPETRNEVVETLPISSGETQEIGGVPAAPPPTTPYPKPETYLQKAKRLGVATHISTGGMRKKTEIVTDIENLEIDEESPEEAKAFSENAQTPPSEDDEYARGMKAEDMV